jgi:hydroxymethylglutaryl-CoA lyase
MTSAAQLPEQIQVVEVAPRDGLQNEPEILSVSDKVAFIDRLTEAGYSRIEMASFVHPKWIPQLADSEAVYRRIKKREGTTYSALVPNMVGMQRAMDAGVRHIAVFTAASESFTRRNINATIEESLSRFEPVLHRASHDGVGVRGYVSTAFGCPYEGEVAVDAVVSIARALCDMGVSEIALGDTIGVATPELVETVMDGLLAHIPVHNIAVHFHDTNGRALSNVLTALRRGVTIVDASAGGLGGCPYAEGASGNLATEDLLSLMQDHDIETGVDINGTSRASLYMEAALGRTLPSRALARFRDVPA